MTIPTYKANVGQYNGPSMNNAGEQANNNLIFEGLAEVNGTITKLASSMYVAEKEHEAEIRNEFLNRLKQKKLNLPDDAKFMVEVEAFALGKTEKSKTLEAVGLSQTVEKAHKLLIETGIWDITRNPYPSRFGLSANSATEGLGTPPEEERVKIPTIAYAIDNEWSTDPDDAISWDGTYLWVHIADPASYVTPDSNIDKVARNRGTTLYIPEGASRMLAETALEDYALGLKEESNALSFRIKLTEENTIEECNSFYINFCFKNITFFNSIFFCKFYSK